MNDYQQLAQDLAVMLHGVPHLVANLANASALLADGIDRINWLGFYLMEKDRLVLGPFQGKPACLEIPIGKGVCGHAVAADTILRVNNVHDFADHIPCDAASMSEIVLPLHRKGKVVAVLDIDSPLPGRFSEEDEAGLSAIARVLEEELSALW